MPNRDSFLSRRMIGEDNRLNSDALDLPLLWTMILLVALGLIMIYSASVDGNLHQADRPYYYLARQGGVVLVSVVIALIWFLFIPMKCLLRLTPYLLIISLLMLVLVLIVGTEVNGARRWIRVAGLVNFQPAELFKIAVVLYLASYLYRRQEVLNDFKKVWSVGVPSGLGAALILASGDLGSTVIIFLITLSLLFVAGVRLSWFLVIILLAVLAVIGAILIAPYRIERIMIFLNPESDPLGAGYQTIQSFIANANGHFFGVGLGNGMARYGLPELHTDFIASLMTEELGAVFTLFLCLVYLWFVIRAFAISKRASNLECYYSSYIAKGIGLWIGLQAFMHLGINAGVLPTKGLTLPFISYGGSSLLACIVAGTILMRIDYESKRIALGHRL